MVRYVESLAIIAPCFVLVFFFLVFWYNITGVILPDSKFDAWLIEDLAALAKPDALFDAATNWALIPTIGQVLATQWANKQFRSVARYTTDRENHKYQSSYENSMIAKRFVFEFCDCFLPLIYLGWYELNFTLLRQTLLAAFVADEIRRVATESLLPYACLNMFGSEGSKARKLAIDLKIKELGSGALASDEANERDKEICRLQQLQELERDPYEIFDDYIEMVVQFGYIVLFASVSVLGPLVTLIFVFTELRSDSWRLEKTLRRPMPAKTHHIGMWIYLLEFMVFLGVLSNVVVTCYGSD